MYLVAGERVVAVGDAPPEAVVDGRGERGPRAAPVRRPTAAQAAEAAQAAAPQPQRARRAKVHVAVALAALWSKVSTELTGGYAKMRKKCCTIGTLKNEPVLR